MVKSLKIAHIGKECVACGCCEGACPTKAIEIKYGIRADIKPEKCVGCGKCAKICPAGIIAIIERGE